MKYKFILFVGIILLSGCSRVPPKENVSPHTPSTTKEEGAAPPDFVSTTLPEGDNRIFSYDFFEDKQNNFFFLYPRGWKSQKNGSEIKFFSPERKNNSELTVTLYKNGTSSPFLCKKLEYKNSHAHFEEKNIVYDCFQKQNGDTLMFQYVNNINRVQIEEGIQYFSFEDEGHHYEDPKYSFWFTYPPLWKVEKRDSSTYEPDLKISPYIHVVADEKRNMGMEYSSGDLYVGVVPETFESLKQKIENLERTPSGQTLTAVSDIQDIFINNLHGKKATHDTPLGISVHFYYFPLSEKSGIFMHTYERTDGKEKIIEKIISSLQIYGVPLSLENFSKKYGFTLPIPSTWKIYESSPVLIGFEDVSGVHTAVIKNPLEENAPPMNIRFEPLEKAPTNRDTLFDTIVVPIKTQDDIKKSAQQIKNNQKSKKIDGIPVLIYFASDPLSGDIFISAEFFYKNNLVTIDLGLYEKMSEIPGSTEKEKIVKDKISEIEKGGGTNESKQQILLFERLVNSLKFH